MKLNLRIPLSLLTAGLFVTLAVATDGGAYKPDTDGGGWTDSECESLLSGFFEGHNYPVYTDDCSGHMELYLACGEPKSDGILPCALGGDADGAADPELLAICFQDGTSSPDCWSMSELLSGYRPMYCEPDAFDDFDCTMYSSTTLSTVLATVELKASAFNDDEIDVYIVPESAIYTPTYGSGCLTLSYDQPITFYRQDSSHDGYGLLTTAESIWSSLDDCEEEIEDPGDTGDTGLNEEEQTESEAKADLANIMGKYQGLRDQETEVRKISYLELLQETFESWNWVLPEEDRVKRFHQARILLKLMTKDESFAQEIEDLVNSYLDGEIEAEIFIRRLLRKLWKQRPEAREDKN